MPKMYSTIFPTIQYENFYIFCFIHYFPICVSFLPYKMFNIYFLNFIFIFSPKNMAESIFGISNSSLIIHPSSTLLIFCSIIRIAELFIHFLLLPISIIFILLIFRTSILHLNLKFILLIQCASNLQYAFGRFIQANLIHFK
jgi:hypothetical protein